MDAVRRFFKVKLSDYLRTLPLPETAAGFLNLSREEYLQLWPFFLFLLLLLYLAFSPLLKYTFQPKKPRPRVNKKQRVNEDKVVDSFDIEDIGKMEKDKVAYCRCWKSAKFPFCDGTHNTHNKETGDNVGPLVIKKSTKKDEKK